MSTIKVALCVVAKWEDYYLDEWLEYNHKLGFDKIIMYQNDWRTDIERPYLEKRIWDGKSVQVPLYNDFLNTNTEYDWVAFIDCDEFIVLKKHNSIIDFLNEYNNCESVCLNWRMFGTSNEKEYRDEPVTSRFRYCSNSINYYVKSISEADLLLVDLYYHNYIDAVLSNDMDYLISGVDTLLINVNGTLKVLKLSEILEMFAVFAVPALIE